MKGSARALLGSAFLVCAIASTGCMPLFPRPSAPFPLLSQSEIRHLLGCENTIARYGRKLVNTQVTAVEACALPLLDARFRFSNEFDSEEEFFDRIDRIRPKCDAGLRKAGRASTLFIDRVIDACDPVAEFILDDDQLRFQMLSEETEGSIDLSTIPLFAGSICGIKSLLASQLVLFQIPRIMELFAYLGTNYIEGITLPDDTNGLIVILGLDDRCVTEL